ncbi:hypothetical protein [Streptomyces sp. NPDC101455]|uniref:hypothetical protein n=1 Tax=Streptomyces sp. NPDC101455 TaxID=3366142 RepID=UPI00381D9020
MKRITRTAVLTAGAFIAARGLPAGTAHAAPTPRVDLRVLVANDGGAAIDALTADLDTWNGQAVTNGRTTSPP